MNDDLPKPDMRRMHDIPVNWTHEDDLPEPDVVVDCRQYAVSKTPLRQETAKTAATTRPDATLRFAGYTSGEWHHFHMLCACCTRTPYSMDAWKISEIAPIVTMREVAPGSPGHCYWMGQCEQCKTIHWLTT